MKFKLFLIVIALLLVAAYLQLKDNSSFNQLLPADATLPDNSKYYGETKDGLFEGKGKLVWADGNKYVGEFKQGLIHGHGELWEHTGSHYKGAFKAGMMDGLGRLEMYDGTVYQGEFRQHFMTGTATMKLPDGSQYEGEFLRGVLIEGSHIDAGGHTYEGTFENWLLQGFGTYTSDQGAVYKGQFEQGILNGDGQITLSDGTSYTGEVKDWLYHGDGQLIDENGDQYKGEFEYGEFHGQGTLILNDAIEGINEVTGTWEYGYNQDDPRPQQRTYSHSEPIDELLYNQNQLLADATAQIEAQNPDTIDLYFFGIAAHSQPVFHKEVHYIENYFKDYLGTTDKSISLVNNTDAEKPLFTNHAFKAVLDDLAGKMDVEQDILFLYLTSHGTEEQIAVTFPGLKLQQVNAKHLGDVISSSPIKFKVIMLSACHSGSFTPYLENENHLIMTAARADRVSFGCGQGSEMTYFAKAIFKEALPKHDAFISAFDAAKTIIEQWENDDFPESEHSEPQIYVGENIEAYLQRWREEGGF